MRRRLWTSLIGVVLIVLATLVYNVATDNTPILGLDLQGGVSVILAPVEPASEQDLIIIRDLIRDELERRGIAEPDVRVQGQTIVVDLPGVRDQGDALSAVDVSGVVELRPVVNFSDCPAPDTSAPALGLGEDTATTVVPATSEPAGFRRPQSPPADSLPTDTAPTDTAPTDTTPLGPIVNEPVPVTPTIAGAELLPNRDGSVVCVGPTQGTGEVFSKGSAQLTGDQGWGVAVDLRSDGQATWNALANECYNATPTCPSTQPGLRGQIAIVLDDVVQSAPQVNQPNFAGSVAITGDFSKAEAEDLVNVLNRGAFPVQVEAQEARTVSASAGSDSLQAAIIAGVVGMLLVVVLLIAYYRWLGLVILGGLFVWAGMVFSMASFVSGWTNYALSLAGVTGIIVAIGVTVDSYVVFFERIKDELRNGRTIKNAAPRSFKMTWRTIWSADVVSLIGAIILFMLSVGSVRGFALYLGLTTICDLLVCYFFTRPAVLLLSQSKLMQKQEHVLGMNVATFMTLDNTISRSGLGRLFKGQTAIDFYGHRRIGLYTAVIIVIVTLVSLFTQGLNLGLDFEGGDAWDIPASETFGVAEAEQVLSDNGISTADARIQLRSSETSDVVTVQVEELPRAEAAKVTADFAAAAGVTTEDVSFSFTSSTWGSEITKKAIRALVVFIIIVSIFISLRFEWRMAIAAIAAMVNDVVAAVGVYSVFQFTVTPATVIAFLTILGYSLYDTIVVFDRVEENEGKFAAVRMPYQDVVNISMNQVLMRSMMTSFSSIIPVLSLLILGSSIMGAVALKEFALALLVGMISGVYSSIFIATPLLAWLKRDVGRKTYRDRLVGDDLRAMVMGAGARARMATEPADSTGDDGERAPVSVGIAQPADQLLTHPPRPRKKKRR